MLHCAPAAAPLRSCRRSRARRCARGASASAASEQPSAPSVVVVGAGWGGWGAAKALCEAGVQVTLLDAGPNPTGAAPFLTPSGKPFEAGTRGFWTDYPNIRALVADSGLPESAVFTDYTTSAFYSPDGLEAVAPVFTGAAAALPSPLGQVAASFSSFRRLPLEDRASMVGLLAAMLDYGKSAESEAAYDRMTAHELCLRMGLSKRLVDDFVRPTLAVGLFAPLETTSALVRPCGRAAPLGLSLRDLTRGGLTPLSPSCKVCLELLYFYAFAHVDSFNVRWIRSATIAKLVRSSLPPSLPPPPPPPPPALTTRPARLLRRSSHRLLSSCPRPTDCGWCRPPASPPWR